MTHYKNTHKFVKWALSKAKEERSIFTCDEGKQYSVIERRWMGQIGNRARNIIAEIGTGSTDLINEEYHHQKVINMAKYRSQYGTLLVVDVKYNLIEASKPPTTQ